VKLKITKALVTSVATSVGILGVSAGVVFGVSAGMYHVNYMDLENMSTRLSSAQNQNTYSQNVKSQWNMNVNLNPKQKDVTQEQWDFLHEGNLVPMPKMLKDGTDPKWTEGTEEEIMHKKWKFASMCIDGSTHSTLDRSFNESLYRGIVSFIQGQAINDTLKGDSTTEPTTLKGNYTAASFKPAEDNNNGLTSTYKAIAAETGFRILGLAGFNHVSPLGDLGTVDSSGRFIFGTQFQDLKKMLMLLIDGSVANNQAISSVLFRADQPGFLAAIAACMYFYNNLQIYHKGFRDLSIGMYGGNPIPTVTVYMGGLQRGIEFFNRFVLYRGLLTNELAFNVYTADNPIEMLGREAYKDLKNLIDYSKNKDNIYAFLKKEQSKYKTIVEVVSDLYEEYKIRVIQLGQYATHFTGSFASGDAIGITKQYLARGASAIVAVAGPQSLDSAQEIQNQGSECIVIGVDTAMENGQYQRAHKKGGLADASVAKTKTGDGEGTYIESTPVHKDNIIKFSCIKDISTVTKKFCDLCIDNKNFDVEDKDNPGQPDPSKAICGVGYQTCGNILNGLISISFDGWHPFVQAMKHIASTDSGITFEDAWTSAATVYLGGVSTEVVPEEVRTSLKDVNRIDTYDKTLQIGKEKTDTVEKYYPHMTAILGKLLEQVKLDFSGMCVIPTFDATGALIKVEEATGEAAKMPILQWLTKNMYFTC